MNAIIKGILEGILKTDKGIYEKPKYVLKFDRIISGEQIGNYSVWDFARYAVAPFQLGIAFLVFEIGENEKAIEFVFNISYSLSPLHLRDYWLKMLL